MSRDTWFKASVVLNIVLVATVLAVTLREPRPSPVTVPTSDPGTEVPRPVERPEKSTVAIPEAAVSDWKELIPSIRNAVPGHVLAAMVQADFDHRWQKRHDELYRRYVDGEVDLDALSVFNIEREIEQERELRAAMGEEKFVEWDKKRQFFDVNLEPLKLSESETDSFYQLRKQLQEQFRQLEIAKEKKEIDLAEYNDLREAAQAEYDKKAKALLGYERFNSTRDAGLSADVRRELAKMNLSNEQIAAVEDLDNQWVQKQADVQRDAELGHIDVEAYEKRMEELRDWRNLELQRTMGTNAFNVYERQQDSRYVDMKNFGDRWGISDADIEFVYEVLKNYDKAAGVHEKQIPILEAHGDTAKRDEVKQTLEKISIETGKVLQDRLGKERFEKLKQNQILPFS